MEANSTRLSIRVVKLSTPYRYFATTPSPLILSLVLFGTLHLHLSSSTICTIPFIFLHQSSTSAPSNQQCSDPLVAHLSRGMLNKSQHDKEGEGNNQTNIPQKISSRSFYNEYHGHKISHLQIIYPLLRESSQALIWTAGDSSLDNKYWFSKTRPAVGGVYANVLDPPVSVCDVTFWLNHLGEDDARYNNNQQSEINASDGNSNGKKKYAAINTAVEATTLNERCRLLRPQDRFLRDHISKEDVLIVSIGGNDIALAPTPCTIASIAGLLCLLNSCLEGGRSFGSCPVSVFITE